MIGKKRLMSLDSGELLVLKDNVTQNAIHHPVEEARELNRQTVLDIDSVIITRLKLGTFDEIDGRNSKVYKLHAKAEVERRQRVAGVFDEFDELDEITNLNNDLYS